MHTPWRWLRRHSGRTKGQGNPVKLAETLKRSRAVSILLALSLVSTLLVAMAGPASAAPPPDPYFNGFETDLTGWTVFGAAFTPTRVATGTAGINSADGSWHAEADGAVPATNWGGFSSVFPAHGYRTAVDIYLDVDAGWANDTRFDWSSAISQPTGAYRRDFVFNAGFYDDATGPGANTNRFVVSASNGATRANSSPKNPDRDPIAIDQTGWYTFEHVFYDDGTGVLAVDLSIYDSSGTLVHSWTLSDPTDVIGVTVGGNLYGWFVSVELDPFAFDNSLRESLPSPNVVGESTYTLCVSLFTGQVLSPAGDECGPYQIELETPSATPLVFCIQNFSQSVTYNFGNPCGPYTQTHTVPDDGDLLTCVSMFTTQNRRVFDHVQCTQYESPNIIPAS